MGTPQFGVPSLLKLSDNRYKPVLCITQPDRQKGRNRIVQPSEVKETAEKLEIPIFQPEEVNDMKSLQVIADYEPDLIVTAAYGGYLGKIIRRIPKSGCLNVHPSLLPKYRGSAPINYTLFNGDNITGVTIFRIVAKMDAGPILAQISIPVDLKDNYTELYNKLSIIGADLLLDSINGITSGNISEKKQDEKDVTMSFKLDKEDLLLQWKNDASTIKRRVKGLAEVPGLTASFRNERIKIIDIDVLSEKSELLSGTVIRIEKNSGLVISTNDYNILLKKVQPANKRIMTAHEFNLGARIFAGEKFGDGF